MVRITYAAWREEGCECELHGHLHIALVTLGKLKKRYRFDTVNVSWSLFTVEAVLVGESGGKL